jgi:hypothetical protein
MRTVNGLEGLADYLHHCVESGSLKLIDDPFWTGFEMYSSLPDRLFRSLSNSALIVVKGDANYRRMFEDRYWPTSTPAQMAAAYFPTPFLLLRTLKSEMVVGLQPGEDERLAAEDRDWMFNGRRGVIHLVQSDS